MNSAIFADTYRLLNRNDRRKCYGVVGLMVMNAFLDFFSLASFLPLIFLIVNPDFVTQNSVARQLYFYFDFSSATKFILAATTLVLLFVLAKNVVSTFISSVKARFAFGIATHLSASAIEHYLALNYQSYTQGDFTQELNRISNYPRAFANNIVLPLTVLISEGLVALLILTAIAFYDLRVLSGLVLILIPAVLLYRLRKVQLKEINQTFKEKNPLQLKYALQVIEGFSEIKAYKRESFFLKRFQTVNESLTRILIKDQFIQDTTARSIEIIMGIVICSLVIYSVSTGQNYHQTLMLLGIYAGSSIRVLPSVNRILHASQQIRTHMYLFHELQPSMNFHHVHAESPAPEPPFNHTIEMRNISFGYPDHAPLLKEFSLLIHKGDKIGITGNSGEGKTTILLILLGLLKPTAGEILMDGIPFANQLGSRKIIGYVPQNPYLLDATIAENIAFGIPPESIDKAKVGRLIRDLGLQEMLDQLPEGINTRIGERGMKFSGGQAQRLSIARALYADAAILLLDEITNQLHAAVELEIMNLLNQLAEKGKTIIIVTHSKSPAGFFKVIYRLEGGRLAGVGVDA